MSKPQRSITSILNRMIVSSFFVGVGTFTYFNFIGNEVELFYQENDINKEIIEAIPSLKNRLYRTCSWLPIRCAEIIYGNTLDKRAFIKYKREILKVPDGENIAVDWAQIHDLYLEDETDIKNMPVVLIFPGLTGGSHSNYVKLSMLELRKRGFMPLVFNPRGTGIKQISKNIFDYRKTAQDIDVVIKHIKEKYPNSNLYLMGFSLGSSYGVTYLSKHENLFQGMVSIANPIDVYKAAQSLNSMRHRIYRYIK